MSSSDFVCAEILSDSESDTEIDLKTISNTATNVDNIATRELPLIKSKISKIKKNITPRIPSTKTALKKYYQETSSIYEIGVDEVGRGPLFGRVYTAAVILPKDDTFNHSMMKDSKKFHSKSKIIEVANYIKENALAWSVTFKDEKIIDDINILQATQLSMHCSILETKKVFEEKMNTEMEYKYNLLIDGNYFNPLTYINKSNNLTYFPYVTVTGGDNAYTSIAAASILAKVERDHYINDLCDQYPELIEHYAIHSNKGYGSKLHMNGIKEHGITQWHRKSFGICKKY